MTKDEELLREDMLRSARSAVEHNARHTFVSLAMMLADYYPKASEEMLDEVVGMVL